MIEQTGARAEADLLADGEVACVDVDGCPVAYARIGADYFAVDDTCTHAKVSLSEGIVDEDDCTLECPKHGALFSLRTGDPLTLPATKPVRVHDIEVGETGVVITLREEGP